HGFYAVCPGRHRITATAGDREITTSFVVYPGEALLLRLDTQAGQWVRISAPEDRAIVDRAATGQRSLLNYYESVADPRLRAVGAVPSGEALSRIAALVKDALAAIKAENEPKASALTEVAGAWIDGVPLRSLAAITSFIGFNAFE